MGETYAALMVSSGVDGLQITQVFGDSATTGQGGERTIAQVDALSEKLWLRVAVAPGARCTFSFSTDGQTFAPIGQEYVATPGRWTGAKVGLVCQGDDAEADFDWFRVN
jgi:hypothetical protein